MPEIDQIVRKGQERLKVLMGGRGGGRMNGGGGGGEGPAMTRGTVVLVLIAAVIGWLFMSFYTVRPEEQSVELTLGKFSSIGNPGLNFAAWPVVTHEIVPVTRASYVSSSEMPWPSATPNMPDRSTAPGACCRAK